MAEEFKIKRSIEEINRKIEKGRSCSFNCGGIF